MKNKLLKVFWESILALMWVLGIISICESFKDGLWTIIYFFPYFYFTFLVLNYILELKSFKKIKSLIYSIKTLIISILLLIIFIILFYLKAVPIFLISVATNFFSFLLTLKISKVLEKNRVDSS